MSDTVLIVDDEELIRETVALHLADDGFKTVSAEDGRQALELMRQIDRVDLIILDLMLPFLSGLDLCRLLRREGNMVPILMLTAKGSETDRVVGLEVGADDYLTKPFGMRELSARCRALLRRERRIMPQQVILQYRDLWMNLDECRVMVRDVLTELSPKEFRLLELFMRNPRRVWSREQLLERVWGPDFMGDSKTVDVHMRWLREKLEVDPSRPEYLVTVRGFGYRFG
jgi:two-component system, OmpR family, phosphate regulon response regulator PhoB